MPGTPDYAADIVPRTGGTNVRIAAFNVENLFSRPIAMDYDTFAQGQPYLDAFHTLNSIFAKPIYSDQDKATILTLMKEHGLHVTRPNNKHLEFRKIRGKLLEKKSGQYQVVADGRPSWVGWIELKEKEVNDNAIMNTARVIAAVNADIVALCEVEDRPGLLRFHDNVLLPILDATNRLGYPFCLAVDGNDLRGIDVAILSRFPISDITTHVFDVPGAPAVFPRDCCEYFIEVPGVTGRLIMMINHFSSRGTDPTGMKKRIVQSRRVAAIVDGRMQQGFTHFVVCGDLNDSPDKAGLGPLIQHSALTDVIKKFATSLDPSGERLGTYETGKTQFDYLLMSPAVEAAAKGAGIERRGHYAPRTWTAFDSVKSSRDAASDHHCVWVDLAL
jgi:endonuclease/exonuclease/phosphatase family metal-dependent hydrolase